MCSDKRAETRAVYHRDIFQIQDKLFLALAKQALNFFAKRNSLLSEHDTPVQLQNGHAIYFVVHNSQSHVCSPSLVGKSLPRKPEQDPKKHQRDSIAHCRLSVTIHLSPRPSWFASHHSAD